MASVKAMKAKPVPEAVFSNSLVNVHSICTGIRSGIVMLITDNDDDDDDDDDALTA